MNKFDSVIEEALGDILGAAQGAYNFNIAQLPEFVKRFKNNKDAQEKLSKKLDQKKTELKFITADTAKKALQELKSPTTTTTPETSTAKFFSPTAVIMEKTEQFEGLMGEIIDVDDPLMVLFKNQLSQIVNQDQNKQNDIDIKNLISQNNTFWIKLTMPKTSNESFDTLVNYQYNVINEAVISQERYATWFIFETDNEAYLHKFKITKVENAPDIKLGKAFRLDDRRGKPTTLLQVGQGTLYPRWYFLNDLTEKKGPLGIAEPKDYKGDVPLEQ